MPLDDRDPYWAKRFRMTPQQMDDLRQTVEAKVRAGYDAGTRAIAKAGEAAGHLQAEAGAAVDRFKTGVQAEMDRVMGRPAIKPTPAAPRPVQAPPRPPSKRDAARNFGAGVIMERISEGEGAGGEGGYEVTYGHGRYYPAGWPKLTDLTLDQVTQLQSEIRKRGGQSPVGKYQFMPGALGDLRMSLKLTGQEKFTPELQDRLMRERMSYRGYDEFLAGKIDAQALQQRFANEWRSVEARNGRTVDGQHLGTTTDQIQSAFGAAKAEADHLIDLGDDPSVLAWR